MTSINIKGEHYQIWEDYSPNQLREIEELLTGLIAAAECEMDEVYLDGYVDGRCGKEQAKRDVKGENECLLA